MNLALPSLIAALILFGIVTILLGPRLRRREKRAELAEVRSEARNALVRCPLRNHEVPSWNTVMAPTQPPSNPDAACFTPRKPLHDFGGQYLCEACAEQSLVWWAQGETESAFRKREEDERAEIRKANEEWFKKLKKDFSDGP